MKVNYKNEIAVALRQVTEHKASLPSDLKFVTQIAYKINFPEQDLEDIKKLINLKPTEHVNNPEGLASNIIKSYYSKYYVSWKPMRKATNSFHLTVNLDPSLVPTEHYKESMSNHEYSIDPTLCLTTTLKDGWIVISYLRTPKDDCGDTLIPDDENLKEAIFHYCLYRYWMSRAIRKEQGADRERDFHLSMFETLAIKAIPHPDIDDLEAIKANSDRLLPNANQHERFFTGLGSREIESKNYNGPKYLW